eukprot:TRINITY_DN17174_c0_g1_i1.p1 TRINITY_DN17174_c0_g1~~TRINITY_DN17174_c0_g1_i1.p1  ORF type:complete len:239 (-),score=36.30 TRINITY_DN17174_c0_g1_i1:38-754(-)
MAAATDDEVMADVDGVLNRCVEDRIEMERIIELLRLFKGRGGEVEGNAMWRLCYCCYLHGDLNIGKDDLKEQLFKEAVDAGKQAVDLLPSSVEANMWYAAAMGAHGNARGIMSSLFYIKPMVAHGTKAIELDPTYHDGAPYRLMGRYYFVSPRWPVGDGDVAKAVAMLEKARPLSTGSGLAATLIFLAEAYASQGQSIKAKEALQELTTMAVPEASNCPTFFRKKQYQAMQMLEAFPN